MNKFASHQVQERAQLRLQQVFYPGGERGKSVNIEASINREVTEAGAELSIIRKGICSLLLTRM